jgi:DNA-directed RNA polymerase specialized sigma24 family protein
VSVSNSGSTAVKPLTKRRKDTSEPYFRRPEVEEQLGYACSLKSDELFAAFPAKSRDEKGYLFDETLVYMVRDALEKGDRADYEALYGALYERIWKILRHFRYRFNKNGEQGQFEEFAQQVSVMITIKLLDIESDAADYAQVNFGDFVVSAARTELKSVYRTASRQTDDSAFWEEGEDQPASRVERIEDLRTGHDKLYELRDVLMKIPEPKRTAVVLVGEGWPIESIDPNEPTVSRLLGVTPRTIRNWLKEARNILGGQ